MFIGVAGGISAWATGYFAHRVPKKILLVSGQVSTHHSVLFVAGLTLFLKLLVAVAVILFALADGPDKYWSHIFPGMILGMIGLAAAYVGVNVAIMGGARPGEEGVVGAMMNTGFQLGATIGLAGKCFRSSPLHIMNLISDRVIPMNFTVVTAITLGVNKDQITSFKGYQASFWSVLAMHGLTILISIGFIH